MATSNYIKQVMDAAGGRNMSAQWFRNKIKELGDPTPTQLIRDGDVRSGRPFVGLLNMFFYDPKMKKTLPYYDRFPLALPIEFYSDGFLGINLHYLSMPIRLRLLDRIMKFANNKKLNENTRILADYQRLKRVREIKPCLKRYLASNIKSNFRRIKADEFVVAALLPVQRFKKKSDGYVHAQSRGMI
tara:strand:+ start:131 stop:691 length:561 start_codon:yes stop_codon:yes gene_type:complete